jgi:putative transposase
VPAAKPPEFRRRAIELARERDEPVKDIAADLGIAESCLRRWMKQADIDDDHLQGGWVYCCAVIDAWSRRVVGWSIADHLRTELVVDALSMAHRQRRPAPGTIVHADRGAQDTSWLLGHRLRTAGLLGSMGRIASSVDYALIESFWSPMQRELLDRRSWTDQAELASAIFEWIEGWSHPRRRHTSIGNVSPASFEALHTDAVTAA